MMKKIVTPLAAVFLLVLSGCAQTPPEPALAATIHRDCGPADGPAFTVEIPLDERGRMIITIWQAPDIAGRASFTLTDPTDATGTASLLRNGDTLEPLSGTITFDGVNAEQSVSGSFRLLSASGEAFEGSFTAEWVDFPALCG